MWVGACGWVWVGGVDGCVGWEQENDGMGASQIPVLSRHASSPTFVYLLLAQGAEAANAEAYATLDNVKQAMGFSAAPRRR